jgi:hypothetical protein
MLSPIIKAYIALAVIAYVSVVGAIAYVAAHFIAKLW